MLRILAGLIPVTRAAASGSPDEAVTGPRRDIGMVFQSSILLPWRTVLDNVLLPAEILGIPRWHGPATARMSCCGWSASKGSTTNIRKS